MRHGNVYRFGDTVAISFGHRCYLAQDEAQRLVAALNAVITSIATESFAQSAVGTFDVVYTTMVKEAAHMECDRQ